MNKPAQTIGRKGKTKMFEIKCKIGELLGWDIRDFELIPSGKKRRSPKLGDGTPRHAAQALRFYGF